MCTGYTLELLTLNDDINIKWNQINIKLLTLIAQVEIDCGIH